MPKTGSLTKIRGMLTKGEKLKLLGLSLGACVLSVSEIFSIGILIPVLGLFLAPEKIHSSKILSDLYVMSGAKDEVSFLTILVAAAFLIFLFKSLYSAAMLYYQQKVMGVIYSRLSSETLRAYLTKPYAFYLDSNSAALFKNVSTEVSNVVYYFLNPVVSVVSESIIIIGISLFLLALYPLLMVILVSVVGIVAIWVNIFFKKRINGYASQRELFNGKMFKVALESLGAIKEIKLYNAQQFFISKYYDATRKYADGFVKFSVLSGLPRYIFELILFAFILSMILASSYMHRTPAEVIPVLVVLAVAALRLLPSFTKIYSSISYLQYGFNSLNIVHEILKDEIEDLEAAPAGSRALRAGPGARTLRLDDVTFRYKAAAQPIFKGLNISIPLGSTVAIAGETGAGKSTLVDIIVGLLGADQGKIFYRDQALDKGNMLQYRRSIGYIPQNIFLTDESISSNIAFGVPAEKVDAEKLRQVIRVSQLEDFVKELPAGVDTHVGEKGVRISGGQKQRIGIARALYRDPEILVLDEATSALDGNTEEKVYNALKNLGRKMTVIIVTHRLHTLEHADHIYVIDGGKIVDEGTFSDLSKGSEAFKRIARQKSEGGDNG
ncbi:MAG: ABC transporter ATP-binding protein [Candidatus Omnitrophica bacterium]|nr:ABC transporter ATP-binding protein [Candidatus Omnitrophota bacterium]MDD5310589.1 ABC transporter ATP-binding protein [Candidatus Omnitrophota bacterium]